MLTYISAFSTVVILLCSHCQLELRITSTWSSTKNLYLAYWYNKILVSDQFIFIKYLYLTFLIHHLVASPPAGHNLAVASSQYEILLCSETMVSDLSHVSELLVSGFGGPVCLVVPGQAALCPWDGGICTRWIWSISPTKISVCGCCEMLVVRVCGLRQNFYVYSLYVILTKMTVY